MRDASGGQQDFRPAIGTGLKILTSLSICRGDPVKISVGLYNLYGSEIAVRELIDAEFISEEVCAEKYKPKMKQNQNAGVI